MRYRILCSCLLSCLVVVANAAAKDLHVSPTGTASGDGSAANPWDLATALSHPNVVAGDVVWLHGGDYVGSFNGQLSGTQASPIVVRSAPGEWARIDGRTSAETTFAFNGSWTIYRDFEITNTDPERWGGRAGGSEVFGANLKLVNLVIHDTGGNGFWSSATNSEMYGCLIYHNGYDDSSRGHGHGIYTQNESGTKTIVDNVVFGGYSFGIHAYTEGGAIQGYDIVGNVWFNAGVASSISGHKDDCLIGGLQPADRIVLRDNLAWAIGGDTRSVQLGYSASNGQVQLENNYFIGALKFEAPWSSIQMNGNTLCTVTGVDTGAYPNNTYLTVTPTVPRVFVRPNQYEPGRANVIVYNWGEAASQPVDLSGVLSVGDGFEIRNAQNYFASPVLTGTYDGSPVSIPQTGLTPVQPIGTPGSYDTADQTGALFNVFVVRKATSTCSTPSECNDNNACTADDCQQGVCVNSPISGCCQTAAQCDDANPCTTDACSAAGCEHTAITGCCQSPADCDDGNGCSTDSCASNICQHESTPGCCATSTDCADTNQCTVDSCEPSTGTCSNAPSANGCAVDTDCDDHDSCTRDHCATSCVCGHEPIEGCQGADGGAGASGGDASASDSATKDGSSVSDGASAVDAAANPGEEGEDGGCGCRTTRGGRSVPALLGILLMAVATRRRSERTRVPDLIKHK